MIQVEIQYSGTSISGLEVTGHADLSAAGTDILCAAVSVLSENLGSSLALLLKIPVDIEKRKGFYSVRVEQSKLSAGTDLLFHSALLGLRVLSEQFPNRLKLL